MKKEILVIDDTAQNLSIISELLKDIYKVKVATSGKKALSYLETSKAPDLILLDIMMPEMDGYEVIKILKNNEKTKDIPVIFLTAMNSNEDEETGLGMGAADYITKPISASIMLSRIKTQLQNKEAADFLKDKNTFLEEEVKKRTKEILDIKDATIFIMASLAETRDLDTGNHLKRTQHYVKALAQELKNHPNFNYYLNDSIIETIFKSAPLHDIGKVGIADRILLKPAKLTYEEFELMKTHTKLGKKAIERAELEIKAEISFLKIAKEIAYSHHEKYDGSGYPLGLIGNQIPIPARLMSLADVYDALISRRVYKEPISHEKAKNIILNSRETHFDPNIVDAFLKIEDRFLEIAKTYDDSEVELKEKKEQIDKILNI